MKRNHAKDGAEAYIMAENSAQNLINIFQNNEVAKISNIRDIYNDAYHSLDEIRKVKEEQFGMPIHEKSTPALLEYCFADSTPLPGLSDAGMCILRFLDNAKALAEAESPEMARSYFVSSCALIKKASIMMTDIGN